MRIRRLMAAALLATVAATLAGGQGVAVAAPDGPVDEWGSEIYWAPSTLQPGEQAMLHIAAINRGGPIDSTARLTFSLPPGVAVERIEVDPIQENWECVGFASVLCETTRDVPALDSQKLIFIVDVAPSASGTAPFTIEITGGGYPDHANTRDVTIGGPRPGFGITPGTLSVGAFADDGGEFTQAGGHPDSFEVEFEFNVDLRGADGILHTGGATPKDVITDLPPGLVGNATAVPRCTAAQFELQECPIESQVGYLLAHTFIGSGSGGANTTVPIYNMVPPPHLPALFYTRVDKFQVVLQPRVTSNGEYAITVAAPNLPAADDVWRQKAVFWGVPGDPTNDPQRCLTGPNQDSLHGSNELCAEPQPYPGEPVAFLSNPTNCADQPKLGLYMSSWENPPADSGAGDFTDPAWESYSVDLPKYTGCELLPFSPSFALAPRASEADSPTGIDVELEIPQGDDDPGELATAHMKSVTATLPEGLTVNPSSANGLEACTIEQIGLVSGVGVTPARFDEEPARCPDASKLGTVEIDTPLLDDPVGGSVYLAEQDRNPFGSLVALYVVAEHPAVRLKLAGVVELDEDTGRVTSTFDHNAQLPFEDLRIRFFDGPRASLASPRTCGAFETVAALAPWSAADPDNPTATETVRSASSFEVTGGPGGLGCPAGLGGRPFEPGFNAGLLGSQAGAAHPFVLRLTRPDGHQELGSMEVSPPAGVAAYLRGIPRCSDAAAEAGACPAASRIGRAVAGAGAGPNPFFVTGGEAFLTGPYKGAPLGLLVQVPAVAGPFDLGMVNVRAAVHVDPRTARLRVVSDPIPQIVEGVPLRVRDIRVVIDRENFTVAPTDCSAKAVEATVHGSHGAAADVSNRFQVGGCAALSFGPRFGFRAVGRRSVRPNEHPRLTATVDFPIDETSEANVKQASVVLPRRMIVDQQNIATTCTRAQFAARACPEETIVGEAIAHSPLLDDPLQGPIYLISSDNPLPDIVADLRGIVDIALFGRIHSKGIRVRNTFDLVPDVPVESFRLKLQGGRDGILVNGANLCRKAKFRRVDVSVDAHNGRSADQRRFIKSRQCVKQRAKKFTQRAKRLRRRAKRAARNANKAKAKKLRQRSKRLNRKAKRIRRNLRQRNGGTASARG